MFQIQAASPQKFPKKENFRWNKYGNSTICENNFEKEIWKFVVIRVTGVNQSGILLLHWLFMFKLVFYQIDFFVIVIMPTAVVFSKL
jgi:hypothetical protein